MVFGWGFFPVLPIKTLLRECNDKSTSVHECLFETLCDKLPTEERTPIYALSSTRSSLKSSSLSVWRPSFYHYPHGSSRTQKFCSTWLIFPKKSTYPSTYRANFHEILNSSDSIICYTGGSKIHNRVGFASSINDKIFAYRHAVRVPCRTSSHTPMPHIYPLSFPASHSNSSLIISDSLSALITISDPYSSHPIVTRIFTLLTAFKSSTLTVSFT